MPNKRNIKHVTVLGSGVMGSRIACHFANVGIKVLLLDIAPSELNSEELAKALTLQSPMVKNRIVNTALQTAIKSNPSPLYRKNMARLITTGNFDDNMKDIAASDWIIEAVIERLDIKQKIFSEVEKYRKPGTIISTNTSGIPIRMMTEGRSDDFKKHFLGTHFFNPPRYLRLLEIIPGKETLPEVISFMEHYGERHLGKTTVLCKDTPAFIANRIGVYGIMSLFHLVEKQGLTVEEVDRLTGPLIGRPKSATFRTCDVVGLDTLVHVAKGLADNLPNDEKKDIFKLPAYISKMVEGGMLGSKTGKGFFNKVKNPDGSSEILTLDLTTLKYRPGTKPKFPSVDMARQTEDMGQRFQILLSAKDKAGDFFRHSFGGLFAYVSNRIPEIADDIYKVDDAMRAGFGWGHGPFEIWDLVGVENGLKVIEAAGEKPAAWVTEMVKAGNKSFYRVANGKREVYNPAKKAYEKIPLSEELISLALIRKDNTIWSNSGSTITHLGDGVLNLEFHTKMNTIGSEVIAGMHKAIDLAETEYKGLVISNDGENFSAGANLGMVFMFAAEQEYDELDFAIRAFQNAMMRVRYSSCPVVVAPHGMVLGGGCEMSMHADKVIAHAEMYMGLVEFGVGVIPGGGGTKEFALRLSDEFKEGDVELNRFRHRFLTIGQAQVSTSAHEAFDLGYLRPGIDEVVVSRAHQLARAKEAVLEMVADGYTRPVERTDIKVLGQTALGLVYVGADSMKSGNYISVHDQKISQKLGFVLAGGDLSVPTLVSERYLLDLERKAFLELCSERKTLERMQSILTGGKVLRN